MSMPKNKGWQYFILGILSGFLISGSFFLLINNPKIYNKPEIINEITGLETNAQEKLMEIITQNVEIVGRIDLNHAGLDELSALPGIGEAKAIAIIDFREKYGLFENIKELLYVPGIGESTFSRIENFIYVDNNK